MVPLEEAHRIWPVAPHPHPIPFLSSSLRSEDLRLSASLSPRSASGTFGVDLRPGEYEAPREGIGPREG